MAPRKRNDRRGSSAGTVFWLAAIVVVLFLFALNWGKIQETLARTNFHEIVKTQTGADKARPPAASAPEPAPSAEPSAPAAQGGRGAPASVAVPDESPLPAGSAVTQPAAPSAGAGGETAASLDADGDYGPGRAASEDDGLGPNGANPFGLALLRPHRRRRRHRRQEVKRSIAASDSPLLDSLDALLKGPSEDEIRKKLISLVPQGTKLLSVQVRGSTAFLNFNEAFMYNHYGIEGYAGQLKQVVYTATSFPTVQDVQILVEGQKHDYLGGEGVYIGTPLSRNSF